MNAKELIEAARNYTNWSLPHGHPEKGFCAWLLSDTETARRHRDDACEAMAQHILATVRPDDDEPVTRERLEADGWELRSHVIKSVGYEMQLRDFTLLVELTEGVADLWADGMSVNPLKSMGCLRRLVAALGE